MRNKRPYVSSLHAHWWYASPCFYMFLLLIYNENRFSEFVFDRKRTGETEISATAVRHWVWVEESGSSRITVSCVYSCGANTRRREHACMIEIHTWFSFVSLLCVMNKGLWVCVVSCDEIWYNEPGSVVPASEICPSSAQAQRGMERANSWFLVA